MAYPTTLSSYSDVDVLAFPIHFAPEEKCIFLWGARTTEIVPAQQRSRQTANFSYTRPTDGSAAHLCPVFPDFLRFLRRQLIDIGSQDSVLPWHCQFSRLASPFLGAVI